MRLISLAALLMTSHALHAGVTYTITDLGTLGGTASFGQAVNSLGDITGYSKNNGDAANQAFVWSNGVITGLKSLGGANGYGTDINTAGTIDG